MTLYIIPKGILEGHFFSSVGLVIPVNPHSPFPKWNTPACRVVSM